MGGGLIAMVYDRPEVIGIDDGGAQIQVLTFAARHGKAVYRVQSFHPIDSQRTFPLIGLADFFISKSQTTPNDANSSGTILDSIALFKARNKLAIDRLYPLALSAINSSPVLMSPVGDIDVGGDGVFVLELLAAIGFFVGVGATAKPRPTFPAPPAIPLIHRATLQTQIESQHWTRSPR